MICLAIIAACGIGFGVWAMLNGNQKIVKSNGQITELNDSIAKKDVTISRLEKSEFVEKNEDANVTKYIYVGEWGLKIKIPENWRDMVDNYTYYNDYPHAVDTISIKERSESPLDNAMLIYYGEQACNETVRGMCSNIDGNDYSVDFNASCSEVFIKYFMNEDNYLKI